MALMSWNLVHGPPWEKGLLQNVAIFNDEEGIH